MNFAYLDPGRDSFRHGVPGCWNEIKVGKPPTTEGDHEYQASVKLGQAADIITQHPVALQLRTLQTMAEIATEKNSTILFPAQFMTTVQEAIAMLNEDSASK